MMGKSLRIEFGKCLYWRKSGDSVGWNRLTDGPGHPPRGCGGAEMGQELQRRTPGTVARADPSWPTVAGTTVRLWFDRHYGRRARRRSLVLALSALGAMALGAGVTLAFTQRETAKIGKAW